ncbi:MAG: response regulator [Pseudoramibacter sp.]
MIKIGIFESDYLMRRALQTLIEDFPDTCICFEVQDDSQAITLIKTHQPELIFIADNLPARGGISLLKSIRQFDQKSTLVLMSASQNPDDVREAIQFGASNFLSKPFAPSLVREILAPFQKQQRAFDDEILRFQSLIEAPDFSAAYTRLPEMVRTLLNDPALTAHYDQIEDRLLAGFAPYGLIPIREAPDALHTDLTHWMPLKLFYTLCGVYEKRAAAQNLLMADILKAAAPGFTRMIKLNEIAASAHLSESYLSAVFKSAMGIGIIEYCHIHRAFTAKYWLHKEGLTASEIAFRFNFKEKSYFSKLFKKYTGLSFNAYKKEAFTLK